ncbi:MAG: EAL domain-containing protein [Sulfurospirillaceae bacterium]|nr:EAL domain-containing protein [Sulfurospirillaceae bacterium]
MRHLNLTKRLFWIIAFFVISSNVIVTMYIYHKSEQLIEARAYSKAKTLQEYFMTMRAVYIQQFLSSKIELNDATVGFLPAHASTHISEELEINSTQGISIRNVSDRPRNPSNKAITIEENAIHYFNNNTQISDKIELIKEGDKEFYFFASPLRIEPYCLKCHGKREEVLPYIANRYTTAYDYKLGEIRGLTSIKIPKGFLFDEVIALFWQEALFNFLVMTILLSFMYIAIKELTKREAEQKQELERLVGQRTESLAQKSLELEKSYEHQKHLYSVLRTVADSNQILITTQTLDELLKQTALCLFSNDSFSHVKIGLWENNALRVKETCGFDEDFELNPLEQMVFDCNDALISTPSTKDIPTICREYMLKYHVTECYTTALKSDKFATVPLGVLSVWTTMPEGFSPEERAMIEELAGDIGFAVNSFLQKESILKLSFYDTLTNLANKTMLSDHARFAMSVSKKNKTYSGLIFMDLDNFKSINDLKGHSAGDKLLVMMSQRLDKLAHQNNMVSRFGGDEFAILVPNISSSLTESAKFVEEMAIAILVAMKEPFVIDKDPFYITVSIGITLFNEHDTIEKIMAHADSAMYVAKASGRDTIRFFDEDIQKTIEEKSFVLHQLRDSLDTKRFELYYQIQVNKEAKIIGVEALVRWQHSEKGLISPAYFIPLCEESGLIIPLGKWVLNEAIEQVVRWSEDKEKANWRVSINVSARQFEQENFVSLVEEAIFNTHINPSLIRLELTESLLIGDAQRALEKILQLKAIGVSLSVDDFGTGYSSLQYLKQLSVDELKIDQSFIRDFLTQKGDALIVEAIISIGKKFNMEVIAEGVETKEQFEKLQEMGCENFQGFYFGKPSLPQKL